MTVPVFNRFFNKSGWEWVYEGTEFKTEFGCSLRLQIFLEIKDIDDISSSISS